MSDPSFLPLAGGCGCETVRFELTAPLLLAAYCHCTRCQRRSGTASAATALITPGSLTFRSGEDRLRTSWAGDGLEKLFCADCGATMFGRRRASGDIVVVRLGAIDGDPRIRPSARQFVADAAPWEPIPDDGLPRFDERIPAGLRP